MPTRKPTKVEEVHVKVTLKKLRATFADKNFIGHHDGNFWCISCDDFDFYMNDKKFTVWKKILRKKVKFPIIFSYSSNAEPERRKEYESQFKIKLL